MNEKVSKILWYFYNIYIFVHNVLYIIYIYDSYISHRIYIFFKYGYKTEYFIFKSNIKLIGVISFILIPIVTRTTIHSSIFSGIFSFI